MIKSGIVPQQLSMPCSLDEAISSDSPVRLISKFVKLVIAQESQIIKEKRSITLQGSASTGRPAYSSETLLMALMFGFYRKIKSSRELERAALYDLEMKWLLNDLRPDHKTICEFIKLNKDTINSFNIGVRKQLKAWKLLQTKRACFDGTKVNAYARREMLSLENAVAELSKAEDSLSKYSDDISKDENGVELELINSRIPKNTLEETIADLTSKIKFMEDSGKYYYSVSDRDCNLMKFHNNGYDTAYNYQLGIDPVNKFIVSDYVTDSANDTQEMPENINVFQEEHGKTLEEADFDGGYFNYDTIQALENEQNIAIYSPAPKIKSEKIKFDYDAENDRYICPQGKYLTLIHKNKKSAKKNKKSKPSIYSVYVCKECEGCALKADCTKSKTGRHISRFWNQDFRDKRKEFGTMKIRLGYVPIHRRGKENVKAELKLFTSAYNIMRFINMLSFDKASAMLDAALEALRMPVIALVFFIKKFIRAIKKIFAFFYIFNPFSIRFGS